MQKIRLHTGAQSTAPLFEVYLCAIKGTRALKFTVAGEKSEKHRHAVDSAIAAVFAAERNAPESALVAAYLVDIAPKVSSKYGAPMGRTGGALDFDMRGYWRARKVPMHGDYDKGGAYWGFRPRGLALYAVQDGVGNVIYVDAKDAKDAINQAAES